MFRVVAKPLLGALILCAWGSVCAQTPRAALVGRVRDSSGGVVPEATIVVRNVNTNETRTASTGTDGEFTIPNLTPGTYDVTVEKKGFRRLEQKGLELEVDQTARLDLQLQVGSMAESVEVTAKVPLLNTDNGSKGDVVVSQEIVEVPLDGRDFTDLALLVPGVTKNARGASGSVMAINGARADNTNFIVDGFHNVNERGGGAQVRPPLDTLQEFKVQTSGYSAEYGRLAGGVLNTELKTGGNQVHGGLFEFLRNDKFDAREFFSPDRPELRRNQFGANLSGPIWVPRVYKGRDRAFFLFGWESFHQIAGQVRLARVPTVLERQGDFSRTVNTDGNVIALKDPRAPGACATVGSTGCFPCNQIPPTRFDSIATQVLAFFPVPNRPAQANNYLVSLNDTSFWNSFVYKLDYRVSSRDNASFRVLTRHNDRLNPFQGSNLGNFGSTIGETFSLFGLTYNHAFAPTLLNELRVGFTRTGHDEKSQDAGHDFASQFGIPGTTTEPSLLGFPRFQIRNVENLGDGPTEPIIFTINDYQAAETLTWVKNRHLVKLGGDLLRTQSFQQSSSNNARGTFNFIGSWTNVPFGDFLLGLPNDDSRQLGANPAYLFWTRASLFVEDDFKATPNLTLNFGLRDEIVTPPAEKYGKFSNFIPFFGKLVIADDREIPDLQQRIASTGLQGKVALARDLALPRSLVYGNYADLAPRFGLAWRPFGGNRSVLRASYGLFYAGSVTDPIRSDLTGSFPLKVSETFNRVASNPSVLTLSNPFPASRAQIQGVLNAFAFELHPAAQYLQSWNFTVEHEIGARAALEVAYVGSKGTHLGRKYDLNQPFRSPALKRPDGTFPRPIPGFNTINFYSFSSDSSYNAGMITLRKRFARGAFYRLSYVFSKSIDDASQISGNSSGGYPGAQNARNLKGERGRSDWDTRHSFTMSFTYETPFRNRLMRGWQVASSGRANTGQPFTPRVSNPALDQGEADRPDRIRDGSLPHPTPDRWFDLSAFPATPRGAFRFGNSGRNILDGPGLIAMNVSLMKKFFVRENRFAQFRWEVFNATNHTNFGLPNDFVNQSNGGTITQVDGARAIQFALKYQF